MKNHQEYAIHIFGKHVQPTESIKAYVLQKLLKVEKITAHMIDVHVKLEVQKIDHIVQITMKFSHFNVQAHAVTHDLYQSIDLCIDRLQRKLLKWKTKIQTHHLKEGKSVNVPIHVFDKGEEELNEINDMIEDANRKSVEELFIAPQVVKHKTKPLKTMTLQEALMKIDLSTDNFLVYRSEEDQKLKVVYRRRDKSYGLLQPE